jgi:hypothetical protein
MSRLLTTVAVILLFVPLTVGISGCGGNSSDPEVASQRHELNEIYAMYSHYLKKNEQPPRSLTDLESYAMVNPSGYRVLQEGKYQFIWGVKNKDSSTVLAFSKETAAQGGSVLMANGSIRSMSAAEVQAVSQATP